MSRPSTFDKFMIWIPVPFWILFFALAVAMQLEGRGTALVGLEVQDRDAYPVLTGHYSAQYASDPLEAAGLQVGDRLLSVGASDLRGVGTYDVFVRVALVSGRDATVPLVYERNGLRRTTFLPVIPAATHRAMVVNSLVLAVSAVLLLLLARPSPTIRAFYGMAMSMALACATQNPAAGFYLPYTVGLLGTVGVGVACFAVFGPLMVRFLLLFPDDRVPEGAWYRWWPWLLSVPQAAFLGLSYTRWISLGDVGGLTVGAVGTCIFLATATYKYRRSAPLVRRQMRWALLGAYGAMLPIAVAEAVAVLEPRLSWVTYLGFGAFVFLPLSIVVSVTRFNLFDIDRILSELASLNAVALGMGAAGVLLVPSVAETLSGTVGMDPATLRWVLSVALVLAVIPIHRIVHPKVEQLVFTARWDLEQRVADAIPGLAECRDAGAVLRCVGETVNELMRPEGCAVHANAGERFTPVFVSHPAEPSVLEATGPLARAMAQRRVPLHLGTLGRRSDDATLAPADRDVAARLISQVVVPVRRDATLSAFVCLGPKHSGDVYTTTDLSHLTAIAEAAARELRRFEPEEFVQVAS